jgi:hypothetical protein
MNISPGRSFTTRLIQPTRLKCRWYACARSTVNSLLSSPPSAALISITLFILPPKKEFDYPIAGVLCLLRATIIHLRLLDRPPRVSIRIIGATTRSLGEQRQEELFVLLRDRCGIACRVSSVGYLQISPSIPGAVSSFSLWQTLKIHFHRAINPVLCRPELTSTHNVTL